MNVRKINWILAASAGIAIVAGGAPLSHAVGTAAGTTVNNRATVTYNGTETVESSPTGNSTPGAGNGSDTAFLVDHMVDLTVSEVDGTYTLVMPGELQRAVGFNVTNTGNELQDIAFIAENSATDPHLLPVPGPDIFDVLNITPAAYYIDDGDGIFQPTGADGPAVTHLDAVVPDIPVFVWVAADIPAGQVPGETSALTLIAEARTNDGAASLGGTMTEDADGDDPALVEILFADGTSGDTLNEVANDARHSDTDAYLIEAELTVAKTSAVVEDPVRGTTNPLAIPGAFLEYTITVDNMSASTAATITLTDQVATPLLAAFRPDSYGVGLGMRYRVDPDGSGPAPFGAYINITNVDTDGDGDFGGTTADTVTVPLPDLLTTEVAEVQFQVVIQ